MATVAPMKDYRVGSSLASSTNAIMPVYLGASFRGAPQPSSVNTSATPYSYALTSFVQPFVRGASWQSPDLVLPIVASECSEQNVLCHKYGRIIGWTILTEGGTGSVEFDVWKQNFSLGMPSVANTIVNGNYPSVVTDVKNRSYNLTGWTTTDVTPSDILTFKVRSNTNFISIQIVLEIEPV